MDKPRPSEQGGIVTVLLGVMRNAAAVREYVTEKYVGDHVDCALWNDLGISWFDHDQQEVFFDELGPRPIAQFVEHPFSYIETYREALLEACVRRGITSADTGVFLFGFDVTKKGYRGCELKVAGTFRYWYEHPEWLKEILR